MIDKDFRPLRDYERDILMRLMDQQFVGREEALLQTEGLEAKQIDDHGCLGCLDFRVASQAVLPYQRGVIVQGDYIDHKLPDEVNEHPMVYILLHVLEGRLWYLDIQRNDFGPIQRRPVPAEIEISTEFPAKRESP